MSEETLYSLLARWEEERIQGQNPSPEEFCAANGCPDQAAALRDAIGKAAAADRRIEAVTPGAGDSSVEAAPGETALPSLPSGYEYLDFLGKGGMGVVHKAHHLALNRIVALKTVLAGALADPGQLARFHAEAQAVARFQHPNIVQIYEVGTAGGLPYFSLEFVDGGSLAGKIARTPQPPRFAAQTVEALARAMSYAHERGVVHRDLKPANILLTRDGTPKVSDFGLAKRLDDDCGQTRGDAVLGTPSYMAPEQAGESGGKVGPLTDVYALGAILYECLTGQPPFDAPTVFDTLQQVRNQDPLPPSQLQPKVPRDLETICLKGLHKEPHRRYASAQALAEDLARWQNGEPIQARPVYKAERLWRWCRRHPGTAIPVLVAAAALLLLAVGGSLLSWWLYEALQSAEQQRELAKAEAARARASEKATKDEKEKAQAAEEEATAQKYLSLVSAANRALNEKRLDDALGILARLADRPAWPELRLLRREAVSGPYVKRRLAEHQWGITAAAVSPDGARLVSAGADGQLLLWDQATGRIVRRLGRFGPDPAVPARLESYPHYYQARHRADPAGPPGEYFSAACWLGASSRVAVASLDGEGIVVDTRDGRRETVLQGAGPLYAVVATPDGSRALFGGASGRVSLRRLAGPAGSEEVNGVGAVLTAAYLASADAWVVGRANGRVELLDGRTLAHRAEVRVTAPVWSIDVADGAAGGQLLVGGGGREIRGFSVRGRPAVIEPAAAPGDFLVLPANERVAPQAVHAVRFAAGGQHAYALDDLGRLVFWERSSGQVRWLVDVVQRDPRQERFAGDAAKEGRPLPLPFRRAGAALFVAANEEVVITGGADGDLKAWDTQVGGLAAHWAVGRKPVLAFDRVRPDLLWAAGQDGSLRLFDVSARRQVAQGPAHEGGVTGLAAVGADGLMVTAGRDGRVKFWRRTGTELRRDGGDIRHERPLVSVAASHDAQRVAAVDAEGWLAVWEVASRRPTVPSIQLQDRANGEPLTGRVAFNCDDSLVAALGPGQSCLLFSTQTFRPLPQQGRLSGKGGTALFWHPTDPSVLFLADDERRWDAVLLPGAGGKAPALGGRTLGELLTPCVAMTATADGSRWLFVEESGRLVFFDPKHLVPVLERPGALPGACDLALSPRGDILAVAHAAGAVEIKDLREPSAPPSPEIVDESARWTVSTLLKDVPGMRLPRAGMGCVEVDGQDRVALLYLAPGEGGPDDREMDLFFAREAAGEPLRERIRQRVFFAPALRLLVGRDHDPVAVFREPTGKGPYEGRVCLARRTGPDHWAVETLLAGGNEGFFPAGVVRDGRPSDLFHFSFDRFYWRHTSCEPGGKSEYLGRQGDGQGLDAVCQPGGRVHFTLIPKRLGIDEELPVYARWDGKGPLLREVIDPEAVSLGSLMLLPNGNPLVPVRRRGPAGTRRWVLAERKEDGWRYEAVPVNLPDDERGWACGPDGRLYVPGRDDKRRRPVLWQRAPGRAWEGTVLPAPEGTSPDWMLARFDSRGRPVVIAGREDPAGVLVYVLRQKE